MVERVIEPEPRHQAVPTEPTVDASGTAYGGLFRYPDEAAGVDASGIAHRGLLPASPRGTTREEYEGPTDDCSEHAPMHEDGGYSTTDSDAEMDALVAQTDRREQAHRLSDHQQELIEHAMRGPEVDGDVRREQLLRMLDQQRELIRMESDQREWE